MIISPSRHRPATIALLAALLGLGACTSDDDGGSAPVGGDTDSSGAADAAGESVQAALTAIPDALFPRFALNNDEVTAEEAFRRIESGSGGMLTTTWGIEGASPEAAAGEDAAEGNPVEIEARYASDGTLVETVRAELVERLPAEVDAALGALYPDAPIEEIERVESDGVVSWTVLLDIDGVEIEPNFDEAGQLLFTEESIEASALPAPVAVVFEAAALSGGAALPEAGYERLERADGTALYSVEFEDDEGRSLTVETSASGEILRVEHEDSLENLSPSESVEEALGAFPAALEPMFATDYPEVSAEEVFRSVDRVDGGATRWGVEGVSADETLAVEAIYSSDGELLELVRERELDTLPGDVAAAFDARYPEGVIEERVESTSASGTQYAILFLSGEEEREVNLDASGAFLSLEDALEEGEIPAPILAAIGAERVRLPIVEFEAVDGVDGSRRYSVEYENETGDSISYELDAAGTILSVDHEGALPR